MPAIAMEFERRILQYKLYCTSVHTVQYVHMYCTYVYMYKYSLKTVPTVILISPLKPSR